MMRNFEAKKSGCGFWMYCPQCKKTSYFLAILGKAEKVRSTMATPAVCEDCGKEVVWNLTVSNWQSIKNKMENFRGVFDHILGTKEEYHE